MERRKKSDIRTISLSDNYINNAERLYPEAFGKNKFSNTVRNLLESKYPLITESNFSHQKYREITEEIENKAQIMRKLNVELDHLKWLQSEYAKKIEKEYNDKRKVENDLDNIKEVE